MKPRHNKKTNYLIFDDFNINLNNMIVSFDKENTTNLELMELQRKMLAEKQSQVINDRSVIETLVINPNNICLGRCIYCYNENSNNITPMSMSMETFIDSIERLKAQYKVSRFKVIRFFGGEPVLNENWKGFIEYLEECKLIDSDTDILISSGLLFSSDIFKSFVTDLVDLKSRLNLTIKVSVSVDFGMVEFTRQNIAGVTQSMLVDRVRLMCHNDIPTALTTNVTKDFCLFMFKTQVRSAYKYVNSKNLFMRVSIVAHNKYTPDRRTVEDLANELLKMQKRYPITTNLFSFDFVLDGGRIIKIDDNHFLVVYYPFYCGMYSQMMEIFPDGSFGACHMDITNKQHVLTDDNPDKQYMFADECSKCQNRLFCRNGCINRRKLVTDPDKRDIYCLWMEKCYLLSWSRVYDKYKSNNKDFKEEFEKRSKVGWESCLKTDC